MAKKEIAKKNESAVFVTDKVPDYINTENNRGSEDVGADDLTIPRLDVIQALSPQIKKSEAKFIEGAEQGMLFNSVTQELYGGSVLVVPVLFRKQYLIWIDRQSGGGFRGAFDSQEEAAEQIAFLEAEGEKKEMEVVDTAQHLCLIIDQETGRVGEIAISMAKSKMKISRQWNSMIRMAGGDRFSRVYRIGSVEDSSDKGDFWNFSIQSAGYPSEAIYKAAEQLYEDMMSGERELKVSTDDVEEGEVEPDKF